MTKFYYNTIHWQKKLRNFIFKSASLCANVYVKKSLVMCDLGNINMLPLIFLCVYTLTIFPVHGLHSWYHLDTVINVQFLNTLSITFLDALYVLLVKPFHPLLKLLII